MRPTHKKGKFIRILLSVALLGIVGFFAGRYVLYVKIRNTIEYELRSLRNQGIHITYDNLSVYPFRGKIEMHELRVKVRKDSLQNDSTDHGLEAYLPYITLEGFALIPFLKEKTIALKRIHSFETYATYRINSTLFEQNKSQKRKIEVQNISVDHVNFPRMDIYLTSEKDEDTVAHILTDVHMQDLFLAKQLDSLTWQKGEVLVSDLALNYQQENYGVSASRLKLAISERTLEIDSLLIKPTLGKDAFMREAGKQCSYMEAFIPSLRVDHIDWYTYPTATLQIDQVSLQLITSMYRDKRLPFLQKEDRPLPSHFLQRIPIQIKIDTIKLSDSFVRYEEMPENGDSTGVVFFQNLNARISNLHNNKKLAVDAKMHAKAKFMGTGDLEAFFTFPHDTLHPYRVSGALRNFPLAGVNKMLGAAAQAKVESGYMRDLQFEFDYNDSHSDGTVMLDYSDLKILALRENKKNEQSVSRVKSILLNAFILKKELNENDKDHKRTGTIGFNRDTKRSVFNFWWKSILSGVKSAYNLDKLPSNAAAAGKKKDKKNKRSLKDVFSKIFK